MLTPRSSVLATRVVLAACGPSLLTLALVAALWQAGPRDFLPLWNDEVVYWNETAVFIRAGFEGGYVTVNERPAPATFSRFGPHGPSAAVLYGAIGRATGWRPYSAYLIHLLLLPVCAGLWLWVTRHRNTLPGAALLIVTFWPLLLYLPSNMQEPLHFALAFLFAALCESHARPARRIAGAAVLLAVACVLRPTWALIIPALMWGRDPGWLRRALSLAIMTAAFLAAFLVVTRMAAPYPYTSWIPAAVANPSAGIGLLLQATAQGVAAFVVPHREWFITIMRLQVVVAGLAALVLWRRVPAGERWRIEVGLLAVLPVLLVMFPVGDIESGREFRILATHLLMALLVTAGLGLRWSLIPALVNLAILTAFVPVFERLHEGRFEGAARVRPFARAVRDVLVFDPAASSGWANTVLVHADVLQPALVGLPAGIGVSFVLDWEDQPMPPRSAYLLLRQRDEPEVLSRARFVRIADTPLGALYRNEASRVTP